MRTKVALAITTTVIIVLGSLTAFLLFALRNENPVIAETVSLEPVSWEGERPPPSIGVAYYHQTISHYYLDAGSINASLYLFQYLGDDLSFWLHLNVTVDLINGYVYGINVTTQNSTLTSQMIPAYGVAFGTLKVENLSILSDNSSSFISFGAVNHPSRATLLTFPRWMITSPDNQTEQTVLTVDVTYFNSTAFKKVTFPFHLNSTSCTNTNVENAVEIKVGEKLTDRVLCYGYRTDEYFKLHLDQGEEVNITMVSPFGANFDLFVYNSSNLIDPSYSSTNPEIQSKNVIFTVNAASWWFIKVSAGGGGAYVLEVASLSGDPC